METDEAKTEKTKRKFGKKGCFGCLGVGAGLIILLALIGSLADSDSTYTDTPPPVETEPPAVEVNAEPVPDPTPPDPEITEDQILVELGEISTELVDLWSRQRELDESTRSFLLASCTDLSFQREQCFMTIASNLYAVRMVIQANRVAMRRIRSFNSTERAREAGDALIRTVNVHHRTDLGTEEALEKLAGQHNLTIAVESAISRLDTQTSPFRDFIDKWSN